MPQPLTDPTAMLDAQTPQGAPEAPPADAAPPVPEIPPVPTVPEPEREVLVEGIPIKKYMELKHREQDQRREVLQLQQELQRYRQPQQPQEIPDPLVDPQGYAQFMAWQNQQIETRIERAMQEQRYTGSEDRARDRYGDDKVEEAITAFEQMPDSAEKQYEWQKFNATRDPWGALVKWYDHQTIVNGIAAAGDQDAWIEQRYAELQARRAQNGQAPAAPSRSSPPAPGTPFRGGPAPRKAPAPSLSNAPPSSSRTSAVISGPGASFDSVFGDK